jgi:hypothetical protein
VGKRAIKNKKELGKKSQKKLKGFGRDVMVGSFVEFRLQQ